MDWVREGRKGRQRRARNAKVLSQGGEECPSHHSHPTLHPPKKEKVSAEVTEKHLS